MEELNNAPTTPAPVEPQNGAPEEVASWEEQLEESLAGSSLSFGEVRQGTILARKEGGLLVGIGAKRDGFVPNDDFEDIPGFEVVIGLELPVAIVKFQGEDGNVLLSISQALLQEDWIKAEALMESQEVVEAPVSGANRGGLTVDFGRLRGFIPMSQLIGFGRIRQASERHRRLRAAVGQTLMLKVIEVNRRRRRLIFSQQAAAKEWRAVRRQQLLEELEADQVRRGRISQITDFGLFINLGGLDGLVHISELSWGRIENPSEVYKVGQRVKVKVLSVDHDRQRIALSIKALTPDPWESVVERYLPGTLVTGVVSQLVDFGAFLEIESGVEGLLHNSELRDVEQRDELTPGTKVLVKVIRVEEDRRRIGLSVRQVRPEEWENWVIEQIEAEEQAKLVAAEAEAADEAEESEDDLDDDFEEVVDNESEDITVDEDELDEDELDEDESMDESDEVSAE